PKPKTFKIHKRAGGFAIVPGPGIDAGALPLKIKIRCAYDVLTGNPFKRYSDLDFSFFSAGLQISTEGAHCWPIEPNQIDVQAERLEFSVEVSGFDSNRDLIIEAQA